MSPTSIPNPPLKSQITNTGTTKVAVYFMSISSWMSSNVRAESWYCFQRVRRLSGCQQTKQWLWKHVI